MRLVATPVPRTAGMAYLRATMELWLKGPPTSVTTAEAMAKSDVHAGVVMPATSTSPGCIWPKSSGPERTRAGAVTWPPLAATPLIVSPVCSSDAADIRRSKTSSQVPLGSSCGGVTRLCPRQSILRCSTGSARLASCVSPASRDEAMSSSSCWRSQNTSAGFSTAPASTRRRPSSRSILRITGQAHVGKGVLAHGRYALRPFEQFAKEISSPGVPLLQHRLCSFLAACGGPPLTLVGVLSLAPKVEPERVEERRGIVGGDRVYKVQVVDGMPVAVQVRLEAGQPLEPLFSVHSGGRHFSPEQIEDLF